MNILHLTHTDIKSDSRILKEMRTVTKLSGKNTVSGIGMQRDDMAKNTSQVQGIYIYSILLRSRKWRFLPNSVRHILTMIELYNLMFYKAI